MAEWTWELLAGPATITEGPAWDGRRLLYTSIEDSEVRASTQQRARSAWSTAIRVARTA